MATDKKFAVAGVSTFEGKTKVRFANDTMRVKILGKNGHSDVQLVDLPHEMTKAEIGAHMIATGRSCHCIRSQEEPPGHSCQGKYCYCREDRSCC
jgi:hypothetical protein